jgi:hypothetical protein
MAIFDTRRIKGGIKMVCNECGFYYRREDEKFPSCKFEPVMNEPAPCEYDDIEEIELEEFEEELY